MSLAFLAFVPAAPADAQYHRVGPSGGSGGSRFDHLPEIPSESPQVRQIVVRSGAWIDGINLGFLLPDGTWHFPRWAGGTGGMPHTFDLREGEHLVSIRGTYEQFVYQLRFLTDRGRSSPVYGTREGRASFMYQTPPGCRIVGFHGRAGRYLDAIGVLVSCREQAASPASATFEVTIPLRRQIRGALTVDPDLPTLDGDAGPDD